MKNSIPIKVKNVIPYGEGLGCKGKLILIKKWIDGLATSKEKFKFTIVIISETETIEVGDNALFIHYYLSGEFTVGGIVEKIVDGIIYFKGNTTGYSIKPLGGKSCYKVLAFPENISPETIKDVENGKLKDGEEVFVECEKQMMEEHSFDYVAYDEGEGDISGTRIIIKLNKDNHIQLFPVKKESNILDLLNNANVVDLLVICHEEAKKHQGTFEETKAGIIKYFKNEGKR